MRLHIVDKSAPVGLLLFTTYEENHREGYCKIPLFHDLGVFLTITIGMW